MTDSVFLNKSVAIIGMARTGMATAEVLSDLGAHVVLYDKKSAHELEREIAQAKRLGVEARPGHAVADLSDAELLIPSPGVPATAPIFEEAQNRGVLVMSEIELAYRIAKAPIVAITGTNGKTTTTVMTGRMLEADGRETYIAGNVVAGDIKLPLISAAHRASANAVIVAEISTFQLEWVSSWKPRVAALLNIGVDHLDRHTPEEYAALKARIFEYQGPEDFAIVNLDNPGSAKAGELVRARRLQFSRVRRVEQGGFIEDGKIKVRIGGKEVSVCSIDEIPIPGTHNQENVLAASCAALAMGANPESLAAAIRDFVPVEHRMEPVATVDGVNYINNSMCTNPEAFARSVEAITGGQVVIAGGKHKGGDLRPMACAIENHVKHLVLIGVSAPEIEEAARSTGFSDISHAGTMEDAVALAASVAAAGDTVMLAPGCASFDMFDSFEDRGRQFKAAVRRRISHGRGEKQ